MSSPEPLSAASGRLHRLLTGGLARVSLDAGKVRLEHHAGKDDAEVSVSSIDTLSVDRLLFWSRMSIRTARGQKHNVAGLGKGAADRLALAIHAAAARNVAPLSEQLKRVDQQRRELFSGRSYLRHSALGEFLDEHQDAIGQIRGLCRLEREALKKIVPQEYDRFGPFTSAKALEAERERANELFIRDCVPAVRRAAGGQGGGPLTDEQAEAIATDEDVTLVLAGAGTGKTTVITGKLAHLVRNQGIAPAEILVLAFNRKAAWEIEERLPEDLAAATVSTFHAFGSSIVAHCEAAPTVSELAEDDSKLKLHRAIDSFLDEMLEDPRQSDALINFILYNRAPWRPAFEFESEAAYDEYVRSVELHTLNGDLVKSLEELTIANHLAEYDVPYRYEASYSVPTATAQRRQYQPDFYLPGHDIYIEHFALDEGGNPPPGWTGYAEGVKWKREIHRQNETTLIETSSWQHAQDTLLPTLREQLEERGVRFRRIPRAVLLQRLREQRYSRLSSLLATFLDHVKTGDLPLAELRRRATRGGDRRRNERFLEVFGQVQARYEQRLADEGKIDFHDMINRAKTHARTDAWRSPFRYVLVDEFQDISAGRMQLLEALKRRGVAYFLVGDDWQSIYRFAGSDVGLLRDCGVHLGHVQQQVLDRTFRFGERILQPSSDFIQRNPEQTRRALRPESDGADRGITVVFDGDPQAGARRALREIASDAGGGQATVLALGRFTNSARALKSLPPCDPLQPEFSTIHRAKGREADYVIVLDLKDDRYGIPCRIEDDPLLELVLPPESDRAWPFAEERRLFYVALTRARTGVWLVTDPVRPSPFVVELLRDSDSLRQSGSGLAPACPRCPGGRLTPSQSQKNLRCTNYPGCRFLAPRCPACDNGFVIVAERRTTDASCTNPHCHALMKTCPRCKVGVLLRNNGESGPFLGCSAFVWAEPPCRYTEEIAV